MVGIELSSTDPLGQPHVILPRPFSTVAQGTDSSQSRSFPSARISSLSTLGARAVLRGLLHAYKRCTSLLARLAALFDRAVSPCLVGAVRRLNGICLATFMAICVALARPNYACAMRFALPGARNPQTSTMEAVLLHKHALYRRAEIESIPELKRAATHHRKIRYTELENQKAAAKRNAGPAAVTIRYSDFVKQAKKRQFESVTFTPDAKRLLAKSRGGSEMFVVKAVPNDPDLLRILRKAGTDISVLPVRPRRKPRSEFSKVIGTSVAAAMLGFLVLAFIRSGAGDGLSILDFGKSSARVQMVPSTGVTFADVAGAQAAKVELEEVVTFLRESEKFTKIGARIPRGIILDGPPGTGKTLLARAVAGEAGVPLLTVSGSEFVEMFVGVGASRVRNLFRKAKKHAPSIIFIDEIDAVGRQRGSGMTGGSDEREQTLNQILVELDGFEGNSGVIVLAATNRSDVLDKALTRPGRFDRRITIDMPDLQGRVAILEVHAKDKKMAPDVDLQSIARRTPGFSGAALKNLMNEAAIFAARQSKSQIDISDVEDALERITVGMAKKNSSMSREKKWLVAYHEAGHAILGSLVPMYDTVQRITITPRGNAGGLTFFSPDESRLESGLFSKQYLLGQLIVALGGRVAEEIVYGVDGVTTGASNDFQQVTRVARKMLTDFGFSKRFPQVTMALPGSREAYGPNANVPGAETLRQLDEELSQMVGSAYQVAKRTLIENRALLEDVAKRLFDQETLTASELQELVASRKARTIRY
ncbi:ATP-dependent zinc metalloprotease FtsH 3 [Porphyridium purpureum]|uniref:ATP-dependent zinc metalloprotease FtsH 3 n=1 Tax=Porphyridium purpureum TaxID=35688 RepID=A0A5J4Z8F3_PORPP|nr:ATP-dependent zinc metalloprotease FtsH 3 [Porphyridium purpureum]|eukprot:POR4422..scf295_1